MGGGGDLFLAPNRGKDRENTDQVTGPKGGQKIKVNSPSGKPPGAHRKKAPILHTGKLGGSPPPPIQREITRSGTTAPNGPLTPPGEKNPRNPAVTQTGHHLETRRLSKVWGQTQENPETCLTTGNEESQQKKNGHPPRRCETCQRAAKQQVSA